MDEANSEEPAKVSADKPPPPVIDAQTIFAGRREVLIELEGVRYRLRITRRNKLILQK